MAYRIEDLFTDRLSRVVARDRPRVLGYGEPDEYEFVVKPGADPSKIALCYEGVEDLRITHSAISSFLHAWQCSVTNALFRTRGVEDRREVLTSYELKTGEDQRARQYGFKVSDYDSTRELVIDPAMVVYCGYLGGEGYDVAYDITVDNSGNAYVTGETRSVLFPVLVGPETSFDGGFPDAFIAKIDGAGILVYCGYLGGSGVERGSGVAVDDAGHAFITGYASFSDDFPTVGGLDSSHNGGADAFVAKIAVDGSGLLYSGYIGGTDSDIGEDIAIDSAGCAYITGTTFSSESSLFPVFAGPDLTYNGASDAFVAKVSSDGTSLDYCGYLGGVGAQSGFGIAVDAAGSAFSHG